MFDTFCDDGIRKLVIGNFLLPDLQLHTDSFTEKFWMKLYLCNPHLLPYEILSVFIQILIFKCYMR